MFSKLYLILHLWGCSAVTSEEFLENIDDRVKTVVVECSLYKVVGNYSKKGTSIQTLYVNFLEQCQ